MNYSLYKLLKSDIEKYFEHTNRPSKTANFLSLYRIFLIPRIFPIGLYRLSHFFYRKNLKFIAKGLSWINFYLNGCEISSSCEIGEGLFLPHTSGMVIGAKKIGKNAVIYHGVTIGAKFIEFEYDNRPTIGDNCFIGCNAVILGKINIGNDCKIGACQFVTHSLKDGTKVV